MTDNTIVQSKIEELKRLLSESGLVLPGDLAALETLEHKFRAASGVEQVWKRVETARNPDRPYALDYITRIFSGWTELHGDRCYGDDGAIIGGLAFLEDGAGSKQAVTILAHQKGRSIKDSIKRNHGMANPEGYRKALRLARQAEKFHRPIITFVDTAGAYPGLGAEERGIGEAIAVNLREFSRLNTPIISIVIGEGGSGGALGISVGDKIYMLENAIYSVISPEGYASILLRDSSRAKDAAAMMRITSEDLLNFQLINGVIPEPPGGAQNDIPAVAASIKQVLLNDIAYFKCHKMEAILRFRAQKFLHSGRWEE
jgi:acetyl-CoA carboxylase carboxyl transferase subunit alpha